MMEIISTERNKIFTVTGISLEQAEAFFDQFKFRVYVCRESSDSSNIVVRCSNKNEGATVRAAIAASQQAKAPAAKSEPRTNSSRRLELLATAERDNLDHGTAWACTAYHVDAKGARPEWEGELICYVYE